MDRRIKDKGFLILIKFCYHILALLYAIYTILGLFGIDAIVLGYFSHVSIFPWTILLLISYRFKFCYVHRLPLWYIAINEILGTIDYYIGIPFNEIKLLVLHLVILASFIFAYSIFYYKCILKNDLDN